MNLNLLDPEIQKFVRNYKEDGATLALAGNPFHTVTIKELWQQIESRKKAEKKLPTWFSTENIFYPPKLNLEQTSSEITARYKASIIEGKSLADISGGFGVDSYYFSKKFEQVSYFEIDTEIANIATHNFQALQTKNIKTYNEDGLQAIENRKFDVIFADPSRRNSAKEKVFLLNECTPNIPENLTQLLDNCETLLLKTSPMLDITAGLKELNAVQEIHVVAVDNDVKEILWVLKKNYYEGIAIKTINIKNDISEIFNFNWQDQASATFGMPQRFLYEPNAALMKSGAFQLISEKLKIKKLHTHTHLYTSEALREFPGRRFLISESLPYSKQVLKTIFAGTIANIAIRNFPESVADIRKKWKIKEGGNYYLFFITNMKNNKQILVCEKI